MEAVAPTCTHGYYVLHTHACGQRNTASSGTVVLDEAATNINCIKSRFLNSVFLMFLVTKWEVCRVSGGKACVLGVLFGLR